MSQVYVIPVSPKSKNGVLDILQKKGYKIDGIVREAICKVLSVGFYSDKSIGFLCSHQGPRSLLDNYGPDAIIVPHDMVEEKIPSVNHTITIDGKTIQISEESYQSLKAHFTGDLA